MNRLLQSLPKRQIEMKIKDMAIKEKRGSDTVSTCWYIIYRWFADMYIQ